MPYMPATFKLLGQKVWDVGAGRWFRVCLSCSAHFHADRADKCYCSSKCQKRGNRTFKQYAPEYTRTDVTRLADALARGFAEDQPRLEGF